MVDDYASRLQAAMSRANVGTAALAKAMGVSYQAVKKALAGGSSSFSAQNNTKAAAILRVSSNWLATGESETPYPVSAAPAPALAQGLSQPFHSINPQRFEWEQMVRGAEPEDLFLCALPDDALAPERPRGTDYVWSRAKAPKVGNVVMVRDGAGLLHARIYGQGARPRHWIAVATGTGYRTLDSDADGLTVVAAAAYKAEP